MSTTPAPTPAPAPATRHERAAGPAGGRARLPRLPPGTGYLALAAGYFLLAQLGFQLVDPGTGMAAWWPPNGLYLAALLLVPARRWPLVILSAALPALLASVLHGRTPALSAVFFAGNSLEALAGAWLVRRFAGRESAVSTVRGALALTVLPALAGGAIAVAVRAVQVVGGGAPFPAAMWIFWTGSTLGVLVVAPPVLAWAGPPLPSRLPPARAAELVGVAALLALALFAFAGGAGPLFADEFVLVPPLLWAAYRFGPRGASAALAFTAAVSVRAIRAPGGPQGLQPSVLGFQIFLAVLIVTVLLLAAAAEEGRGAERRLARSRDLLDAFFRNSPIGMFIKDQEHRAVVLSDDFARLLGRPLEGLLGLTVAETIPGELGARLLAQERAVVAGGRAVREQIRFGDRSFLDVTFPIPGGEGGTFVGGFSVDVTERVRAEEALRDREARLRLVEAAVDQASDAISVLDADGRFVWANAAAARALGRPKEQVVGARLLDLRLELTDGAWRRMWDQAARGVAVREEPVPGPDGRPVPGEVASAVIEFGGRRYFVSSSRDVSDRRRAEAAARLAGVGTLAAGVAHEINNPLAYVLANLSWLRDRLDALPPARAPDGWPRAEVTQVLAEAESGAGRVRDIVRDLRHFARPHEGVGPVDVRGPVRSALAIAQNEISHRARLETRLAEVPAVLGNESRLAQVFLNLLTNAAQAIPEGHASENLIRVSVGRGPVGQVAVEVADSGAGMAPEVRARVFEPFFTTKPVGAGTGLGLFICHGIVAGAGGRIELESEPGRGSTFRVLLPVAAQRPAAPPAAAPASPGPRRGRVLVVDDDERVGNALRRMLQGEHEVTLEVRARAALERARAGERWDVLLCDLMMPDMGGMELHEELRRLEPALAARMVFITGGAFTPAARDFLDRVANLRLEKPVGAAALRALVAERLAAAASGA